MNEINRDHSQTITVTQSADNRGHRGSQAIRMQNGRDMLQSLACSALAVS